MPWRCHLWFRQNRNLHVQKVLEQTFLGSKRTSNLRCFECVNHLKASCLSSLAFWSSLVIKKDEKSYALYLANFKAFELEFRTSFGHQKVVLFWISSQNCICLHSSFSEFLTIIQNLQKNNIVLTSKKHWFSFFCY